MQQAQRLNALSSLLGNISTSRSTGIAHPPATSRMGSLQLLWLNLSTGFFQQNMHAMKDAIVYALAGSVEGYGTEDNISATRSLLKHHCSRQVLLEASHMLPRLMALRSTTFHLPSFREL